VTRGGSYGFDGSFVWKSFTLLGFVPWVGDGSDDPIEPSLEEEGSLNSTLRLARPERFGARAGSMLAMAFD
jgi:hypothetical protein